VYLGIGPFYPEIKETSKIFVKPIKLVVIKTTVSFYKRDGKVNNKTQARRPAFYIIINKLSGDKV
jgi:hypothetical protein